MYVRYKLPYSLSVLRTARTNLLSSIPAQPPPYMGNALTSHYHHSTIQYRNMHPHTLKFVHIYFSRLTYNQSGFTCQKIT